MITPVEILMKYAIEDLGSLAGANIAPTKQPPKNPNAIFAMVYSQAIPTSPATFVKCSFAARAASSGFSM